MSTKQKVEAVLFDLCDALPYEREDDMRLVAQRIVAMCEKCAREVRS